VVLLQTVLEKGFSTRAHILGTFEGELPGKGREDVRNTSKLMVGRKHNL